MCYALSHVKVIFMCIPSIGGFCGRHLPLHGEQFRINTEKIIYIFTCYVTMATRDTDAKKHVFFDYAHFCKEYLAYLKQSANRPTFNFKLIVIFFNFVFISNRPQINKQQCYSVKILQCL